MNVVAIREAFHDCQTVYTHSDVCAGDGALLTVAGAALQQIHDCGVLVNDLHPKNVVIRQDENQVHVFFVDFSHSRLESPSAAQREHEMASLHMALSGLSPVC
jgi:tRNA A-37 threonylcarbamoyl transferase component Bud32